MNISYISPSEAFKFRFFTQRNICLIHQENGIFLFITHFSVILGYIWKLVYLEKASLQHKQNNVLSQYAL